MISIKAKLLSDFPQEVTIKVNANDSVSCLKGFTSVAFGTPIEKQRLVYCGKTLSDCDTIGSLKIADGGKVYVMLKDNSKPSHNETALANDLRFFLRSQFTDNDSKQIAQCFIKRMKTTVDKLSLDDIERIASYKLQQKSAQSSKP